MQAPSSSSSEMLDDFRCRLCLSSTDPNMRPLFPPGENCSVNDLLSRIYDCLAIHVSFLEDFCSVICSMCHEKIDSFYSFKKQCQSNDQYLRRKRTRIFGGTEFERIRHDSSPGIASFEGQIKEPEDDVLINQAKDIFFPAGGTEELGADSAREVAAQRKAAQSNDGSSSESFCGFSTESCSRRSPRIFIKKSMTEAFERQEQQEYVKSVDVDQLRQCRISLEKLDIKPNVTELIGRRVNSKEPRRPKVKAKREPIVKEAENSKVRKKMAVLYFEGYEYRKPKPSLDGGVVWACRTRSCPVRLEKGRISKIKLRSGPHQHPPQVIRDGTISNQKLRKRIPFLLVKANGQQTLVYNDSYRYRFARKLSNGQRVWTCEGQPWGCNAYVRILDDFQHIVCVSEHNHPRVKMILKRNGEKNDKKMPKRVASLSRKNTEI